MPATSRNRFDTDDIVEQTQRHFNFSLQLQVLPNVPSVRRGEKKLFEPTNQPKLLFHPLRNYSQIFLIYILIKIMLADAYMTQLPIKIPVCRRLLQDRVFTLILLNYSRRHSCRNDRASPLRESDGECDTFRSHFSNFFVRYRSRFSNPSSALGRIFKF